MRTMFLKLLGGLLLVVLPTLALTQSHPEIIVTFSSVQPIPVGNTPILTGLAILAAVLLFNRNSLSRRTGRLMGLLAATLLLGGWLHIDSVQAQLSRADRILTLVTNPSTLQVLIGESEALSVRNDTAEAVILQSIAIASDPDNAYRIDDTSNAGACRSGQSLPAGASCTLQVIYTGDTTTDGTSLSLDALITRVRQLADGTREPTPDAELAEAFEQPQTPEVLARKRRLALNHELLLYAVDPEPSWVTTRASANLIVAQRQGSYSVQLNKIDEAGNDLGPLGGADIARLRLELRVQEDETTVNYIPREYHGDYVRWNSQVPGQLLITLPPNLQQGRLLIGVRPDFADPGQSAIAERWSVPIMVEIWPTKPGVTPIALDTVYFPTQYTEDTRPRAGSAFSFEQIQQYMQAAAGTLDSALFKPLVVANAHLNVGQLIDLRLPHPQGGIYPYGGRVLQVIEGANGQQLALISFEIVDVYERLQSDPLVSSGLMPEFVSYRVGDALPATGEQIQALPTSLVPDERKGILSQEGKKTARFLGTNNWAFKECAYGDSAFVFTPIFTLPIDVYGIAEFSYFDAGVEVTVGAAGQKIECKFTFKPDIDLGARLSNSTPLTALLKRVLGAEVSLTPAGEVKVAVTGVGLIEQTAVVKWKGKASIASGFNSEYMFNIVGNSATGLDGLPLLRGAEIAGSLTLGGKLSFGSYEWLSWLSKAFSSELLSLEAKAGLGASLKAESANAAQVKQGFTPSSVALSVGPVAEVKLSTPKLATYLQALGIRFEIKAQIPPKTFDFKAKAEYTVDGVEEQGNGQAQVKISSLAGKLLSRFFPVPDVATGYLNLPGSSVYNDPTGNVNYDVAECKAGVITSPVIGCLSSMEFFCGPVAGTAKFCSDIWIAPVVAKGVMGKVAETTGRMGVGETPATAGVSQGPLFLAGTPLIPGDHPDYLAPGANASFKASDLCTKRGVTRDKIKVFKGAQLFDEAANILTCTDGGPGGSGSGSGSGGDSGDTGSGAGGGDSAWSDPHLITADGLAYDYIASGDYILARQHDAAEQPVPGFEVQARFLPGYDVSWPQAAAMQVGDDVVEVRVERIFMNHALNALEVRVNGQLLAQLNDDRYWSAMRNQRLLALPGGGLLHFDRFSGLAGGRYWAPNTLTVLWPQGAAEHYGVTLSTPYIEEDQATGNELPLLDIQIIRPEAGTATLRERGLLGNNDGDPNNDFIRRNGQVLGQDAALSWTALYGLFGGDWLVKEHECLFASGCIVKPDFPTQAVVLTPEQRAIGETACAQLVGYYREACIMDVGLSGSVELVRAYYASTDDLNAMAEQLVQPGVEVPVYRLEAGASTPLPSGQGTRQEYRVIHVDGAGSFLLSIRPPRGASAYFSEGSVGASQKHLTGTGDLNASVDLRCDQPDAQWAQLGEVWPMAGAVQLWAIDPLSGTARQLLGEHALYCQIAETGLTKIAAGFASLVVGEDGRLWKWGIHSYSYSPDLHSPTILDVSALDSSRVVSVASGGIHALALTEQGRLLAWGDNQHGQLTPVTVDVSALGGAPVASVVAGGAHSLMLDVQGQLWAWGSNYYGQLGDGSMTDRLSPVAVNLTTLPSLRVASVAAGGNHSLMLDTQGRLWAWGANTHGQLGDGSQANSQGAQNSPLPVAVNLTALSGARVVSMAAGAYHSLALDEQGRLWAWGDNQYSQLGDGSTTNRSSPVAVDLTALGDARVVSMAAGNVHSLALDDQGRLWAWGSNWDGQLGDGSTTNRSSPVAVDLTALGDARVVSMAAGNVHSLALDDQGRLWAWGNNESGQLGNGSTVDSPTPVLVGDLDGPWPLQPLLAEFSIPIPQPLTLDLGVWTWMGVGTIALHPPVMDPFGPDQVVSREVFVQGSGWKLPNDVTSITLPEKQPEQKFAVAAQCTQAGTQVQPLQLVDGAGNLLLEASPQVVCVPPPPPTAPLIGWVPSLAVDGTLILTLKNNNEVGTANVRFVPTTGLTLVGDATFSLVTSEWRDLFLQGFDCVAPPTTLGRLEFLDATGTVFGQQELPSPPDLCPATAQVSRYVAGFGESLVLDNTNRLWRWGGAGSSCSAVESVVDLTALDGVPVVSVVTGWDHSLVRDDQGRLWAWGTNGEGQLGDGSTVNSPTPVAVNLTALGSARVVSVVAGGWHSLALDDQGRLWAWGSNDWGGQLGDGSAQNASTPVAVNLTALGSARVVSMVAGNTHSLALDDQGRLWAWGANGEGQLGDGSTVNSPTPVAVNLTALGSARVVSMAAGLDHSLALDDQGRLWAWGANWDGQLGDGSTEGRTTPVAVNLTALGSARVVSTAGGGGYSLALDDQGRLWAWGSNWDGRLGDGSMEGHTTPVAVNLTALGSARVVSVSAGESHSLALDDQGRLWAWGNNGSGQLGDGSVQNRLIPVAASPGQGVEYPECSE